MGWLATALLPIALGCAFAAVALATSPAHIDLFDGVVLTAIYALLGGALGFGQRAAARTARPLGWLAALAVGFIGIWHLREQLAIPESREAYAAASIALGFVVMLVAGRSASARRDGGAASPAASRLWIVTAMCAVLCAAASVTAYRASNELRWRLLRHNTLLGTPLYYALATPLEEVCERQWTQPQGDAPASVAPGPSVRSPGGPRPPNIVFVLLDTLRADALEAYRLRMRGEGNLPVRRAPMPLLDQWAEKAARFTNVDGNATWTRPSVASLLTGLAPEEHGATDRPYRLSGAVELLPERLGHLGYRTAAFVSNWAAVGREAGFDQGFDVFEEVHAHAQPYARAEEVNLAVRGWLTASRDVARPLFLYLHYLDPHMPYTLGATPSPWPERRAASAYARELDHLDHHLVPLLEELDARLEGPTLFFVTSDHGEEFGEHHEVGHGHSLYRETNRLPALLRGPGIEPGPLDQRLEARHFYELLSSFASGDARPLPVRVDGLEEPVRRASVELTTPYAVHRPYRARVCMRSVESEGFMAIWSGYGETLELYDLRSDPLQRRNLARKHPERARSSMAALEAPGWHRAAREPIHESGESLELLCALGYAECEDDGRAAD